MKPLLAAVTVSGVERLSPSYVRVELAAPELRDFGVDGPLYDQRIKLLFPGPSGTLPQLTSGNWWAELSALPEEQRGHVRTYTIREVRGAGEETRLVVDFVLHADAHGPGSGWASSAGVGDRIMVLCPRRGTPFGGIEFEPPKGDRVLLAGDETAVPAMAAILAQLPADAEGAAFLEVPHRDDVQQLTAPDGVRLHWLPREGASLGERLHMAVLAHVGATTPPPVVADEEVDPDLWETPTWSSSGEPTVLDASAAAEAACGPLADLYAWIAGEAKVVTGLRRVLVAELGMDRSKVAFMGYWRRGVPMRS